MWGARTRGGYGKTQTKSQPRLIVRHNPDKECFCTGPYPAPLPGCVERRFFQGKGARGPAKQPEHEVRGRQRAREVAERGPLGAQEDDEESHFDLGLTVVSGLHTQCTRPAVPKRARNSIVLQKRTLFVLEYPECERGLRILYPRPRPSPTPSRTQSPAHHAGQMVVTRVDSAPPLTSLCGSANGTLRD